jgi:AraC-like DNA-binding protein
MSVSSFHHHFKTVTAVSPLQFQKQIRLQEARQLMLGEGLDAASAGYRVGYTTPHTLAGSTKGFSACRRCATWNDCGKPLGKATAVGSSSRPRCRRSCLRRSCRCIARCHLGTALGFGWLPPILP